VDAFFDVGPLDNVARHELLPGSINEYRDETLPAPMNMVLQRADRPPVSVYSVKGADLYVSPFGYQLIDPDHNWFVPTASSRSFSKLVVSVPTLPISDDVVIIQDRYPAENFAHFLFDWISRLGLFLEYGPAPSPQCVFVMGGIVDHFRSLLLQAVKSTYGVDLNRFFFPEDAIRLRTSGTVYWFSDQVENYMHPAQMAHHKSIQVIEKISQAIDVAKGPFDRIYISRGDTGRRRVANEDELWHELSRYGFEMIRLADHEVAKQISLVRGAEVIVAPHGMGLTHLALHQGRPSVIELFNPKRGGDDYAFISKAMNFHYQFILGEVLEDDFDDFLISPSSLAAALGKLELGVRMRQSSRPSPNIIPSSATFAAHWHPGWQSDRARISDEIPAMITGSLIMRHVRGHSDVQPDSNAGAWSGVPIEESRIYTASCWAWIPGDFVGERVFISLGEWPRQTQRAADLGIRDRWQRLTVSATSPSGTDQCNMVLRIDAKDGVTVFSTCWQLELGPQATEYIATE
jgi:hypothetical protein